MLFFFFFVFFLKLPAELALSDLSGQTAPNTRGGGGSVGEGLPRTLPWLPLSIQRDLSASS